MKIKNINAATIKESYNQGKEALGKAYKTVKQKAEPIINETISYAQNTMNPPKINVLRDNMLEAQKKYFKQTLKVASTKRFFSKSHMQIYEQEKELMKLDNKAQIAIEKYNRFASKQQAAQKAFEELNLISTTV